VTNIVFSNGNLDPWSGGGVTFNVTASPSVVAIVIEQVPFARAVAHLHPPPPTTGARPCLCACAGQG
jgi:hypothetical protein